MKVEQPEDRVETGVAEFRSPGTGGVDAGEINGVATPGTEKSDRIFGIVAGVMIALAFYLLINALVRPSVTDGPPRLELVEPAAGDTVTLPVTVRLRSSAPLTVQPGGWGVPNFHLHVEVAGVELMPGANDMRPASVGEYLWELPTVPSGPTSMRLFWADAAHRAVADGASGSIDIVVR